jgi:hypothetical protein
MRTVTFGGTEAPLRAAARGAHRRDARAVAVCACRRRGRRLHGARSGARCAAVAAARDSRGRGGCARRSIRRTWSDYLEREREPMRTTAPRRPGEPELGSTVT